MIVTRVSTVITLRTGKHDYFTNWETTTRKQRSQQRYENVKRGCDYRNKKASSRSKCMFCGKNKPIHKRQAEKNGLNWSEYSREGRNKFGYPALKTCWACKNSHVSVLTRKQATTKFSVNKKQVLEGTKEFSSLRTMGRSFHHQPVTSYAEVTLNSQYFWYPHLKEEALARGWRPRGARQLEVPWIPKNADVKLLKPPSRKRKETDQTASKTPKATKKPAIANVVTVSGGRDTSQSRSEAKKPSAASKMRPQDLFKKKDEKTDSSDGHGGDWRVSGAMDY